MYFKNIKNVIIDVDGSGNVDILKDLTAKAKVSDALINNAGFYQTVEVIDGERPDHLSQRLYGSDIYHWTFLLLNPQIKNVWDDWPMKYSQLIEYCTNKYQYLAADTSDNLTNTSRITSAAGGHKFIIGESVTGSLSEAAGTVKEVHVNMGYVVIEPTSISNQVVTAGSFILNSWYKIITLGNVNALTDYTLIGAANNNVGTIFQTTGAGSGTGTAQGIPRTFTESGETIWGTDSQDNVSCNFIKSQAYAPHHHIDDSTGAWVSRQVVGTSPYSYIDYELAITEQNRNIKVIKPLHIITIANQFAKVMGG